jgi:hypothetical protein
MNAFPGVDGRESLDLGERGRIITASGLIVGATQGDVASALAIFRSYKDGLAYVLTDQFGVSFSNVKLMRFQPSGRVGYSTTHGAYTYAYEATFEQL